MPVVGPDWAQHTITSPIFARQPSETEGPITVSTEAGQFTVQYPDVLVSTIGGHLFRIPKAVWDAITQ